MTDVEARTVPSLLTPVASSSPLNRTRSSSSSSSILVNKLKLAAEPPSLLSSNQKQIICSDEIFEDKPADEEDSSKIINKNTQIGVQQPIMTPISHHSKALGSTRRLSRPLGVREDRERREEVQKKMEELRKKLKEAEEKISKGIEQTTARIQAQKLSASQPIPEVFLPVSIDEEEKSKEEKTIECPSPLPPSVEKKINPTVLELQSLLNKEREFIQGMGNKFSSRDKHFQEEIDNLKKKAEREREEAKRRTEREHQDRLERIEEEKMELQQQVKDLTFEVTNVKESLNQKVSELEKRNQELQEVYQQERQLQLAIFVLLAIIVLLISFITSARSTC